MALLSSRAIFLIQTRRSYTLDAPLAIEPPSTIENEKIALMDIEKFLSIATTAPSADNSQPWQFLVGEDVLSVTYRHRPSVLDPFGPLGHGIMISGGALHYNIEQITSNAATSLRLTGKAAESWTLEIPMAAIRAADDNADYSSITNRHTNRHPFKPIPAEPLLPPGEQSTTKIHLLKNRFAIKEIASCLTLCSEARFNNQELHEWLFSSLRWNDKEASNGTGLDISTLHLPPGGRQVMRFLSPWERMRQLNQLGLYKLMSIAESSPLKAAPAIVAFSGKRTTQDIWEAGKQIQKTWISLNRQGIAVHPYYAVTDLCNRLHLGQLAPEWEAPVKAAENKVRQLLELQQDEQLHMLFRIGAPTVSPVRSQRLPPRAFLAQS